jgi:hypothetical protein
MKTRLPIPLTILFCFLLLAENVQSQTLWQDYDYLEITLSYEGSFGGKKSIKLVQFSQDSYSFLYTPIIKSGKDYWRRDELIKENTIPCSVFDSVKEEIHKIRSEDILLHNKNIDISDGYGVQLKLTNGNAHVSYKLHTPKKKDDHIEGFKNAANLMLSLVGTTWEKWIK